MRVELVNTGDPKKEKKEFYLDECPSFSEGDRINMDGECLKIMQVYHEIDHCMSQDETDKMIYSMKISVINETF